MFAECVCTKGSSIRSIGRQICYVKFMKCSLAESGSHQKKYKRIGKQETILGTRLSKPCTCSGCSTSGANLQLPSTTNRVSRTPCRRLIVRLNLLEILLGELATNNLLLATCWRLASKDFLVKTLTETLAETSASTSIVETGYYPVNSEKFANKPGDVKWLEMTGNAGLSSHFLHRPHGFLSTSKLIETVLHADKYPNIDALPMLHRCYFRILLRCLQALLKLFLQVPDGSLPFTSWYRPHCSSHCSTLFQFETFKRFTI